MATSVELTPSDIAIAPLPVVEPIAGALAVPVVTPKKSVELRKRINTNRSRFRRQPSAARALKLYSQIHGIKEEEINLSIVDVIASLKN
jgi:hypothetical protein